MALNLLDFNKAPRQNCIPLWGSFPQAPSSLQQFHDCLQEHGIDASGGFLVEGKVTRATCSCKPHKKGSEGNAWYIYHADPPASLAWGCWNVDCRNSSGGKLTASGEKPLTSAEKEILKTREEDIRRAREEERQKQEQATRYEATRLWGEGLDASDHPYVGKKKINPVGVRRLGDMLLIPMSETGDGEPASLQRIYPDGPKKFLRGTYNAVRGPLFMALQGDPAEPIYVVEGYATGCTVHEATAATVVIAFSAGKLPEVAEKIREFSPDREIIIAGDKGNGSDKAIEAARKIAGKYAFPDMPEGNDGTDFNDLGQVAGIEEVTRQLKMAGKMSPALLTRSKTGAEYRALDIVIEWLVEGLIPLGAVILFYARGGMGKSTLISQIAGSMARGATIFGLKTRTTKVFYIDFENPVSVISCRSKKIDMDLVNILDSSSKPPKMDKASWVEYLELVRYYPGCVFIFDTLRSSHSGDENSSQDMELVMERYREIRDAGSTVIILHHTTKAADMKYKGSTAIFDMADHVLALYPVRKGSDQELEDNCEDTEKVYRLGTKDKTRYDLFKTHLIFDKENGQFLPADSPEIGEMKILQDIIADIHERTSANQKNIIEHARKYEGLINASEQNVRKLLKKGTDVYWTVRKGLHNAVIYSPIESSLMDTNNVNSEQNRAGTEFDSLTDLSCQTVKHDEQGIYEATIQLNNQQELLEPPRETLM